MMKKLVFALTLAFLLSFMLPAQFKAVEVKAPTGYPVHNLNTGLNYTSIQVAIDAPETLDGHTIYVDAGYYYENVVVNKSVKLLGEAESKTVIDGNGTDTGIHIQSPSVELRHFSVINCYNEGLWIDSGGSNAVVENNIIHKNAHGIWLAASQCKILTNNISSNNFKGIHVHGGLNNRIKGNYFSNTTHSIWLDPMGAGTGQVIINNTFNSSPLWIATSENLVSANVFTTSTPFGEGIRIESSHRNIISRNVLNSTIIYIGRSGNTTVFGNILRNCNIVIMEGEFGNRFFHNAFSSPAEYAFTSYNYSWDNGFEGNYWSDYNGTDGNSDGIGDTPYCIYDGFNASQYQLDRYPLMGMFSDLNITSEYQVQTTSNSTISNPSFNGTAIFFDVTGENSTAGFCRICIPVALMNITYRVFVNGTEILPPPEPLPCSNTTHDYLYFTYSHSTQEVIIIPEFPSFIVLPLFMIATSLAAIILKRRKYLTKISDK